MTHFSRVSSLTSKLLTLCLGLGFGGAIPAQLDVARYGGIHARLPDIIKARTRGVGCGSWYGPYSEVHKAVRSGGVPEPHRYSVMISTESGLADRLGAGLSVFLYSVLTNRTFEYMWYGQHDLWSSYQSLWIDWRVPRHRASLDAVKSSASGQPLEVNDAELAAPGGNSPPPENHHWSRPGRSFTSANFYIDPGNIPARQHVKNLFTHGDLTAFGAGFDVVLWTLNQGTMNGAFRNHNLVQKLGELGMTWERAVPCLFNYLFVPSPEALAPFRNSALLETLLDPHNEVVGIQVRLGDWVFQQQGAAGTSTEADETQVIWHSEAHFNCAEQLTAELEGSGLAPDPATGPGPAADAGGRPGRRHVFWLLISDSAALRAAAMRRYGGAGRLLVAQGVPLDHVQDHPFHGQDGLHAAVSELWLFGLASAHVVTKASAYGRLGALAGGPWLRHGPDAPLSRIYGIASGRRSCSLSRPDSLGDVASWWTVIRHRHRHSRQRLRQ